MAKRKRKLTAAEKAEKERRRPEYMTIFVGGKQKRVRRPPTIEGIPVEEFIRANADPIWLHQHEMWDEMPEDWSPDRSLPQMQLVDAKRLSTLLAGRVVSHVMNHDSATIVVHFTDGSCFLIAQTEDGVSASVEDVRPSRAAVGSTEQPTARQREYLNFIRKYMLLNFESPSESDIQQHFMVSAFRPRDDQNTRAAWVHHACPRLPRSSGASVDSHRARFVLILSSRCGDFSAHLEFPIFDVLINP